MASVAVVYASWGLCRHLLGAFPEQIRVAWERLCLHSVLWERPLTLRSAHIGPHKICPSGEDTIGRSWASWTF